MNKETSTLYNNRIALVALTQNTEFYRKVCHELHDCAAHLTAVSLDGQVTSGWDAGEATRIEHATPETYLAMILILDKEGATQLSSSSAAVAFIRSFVKENKPSISIGDEEEYIKSIGILSDDELQSDLFKKQEIVRRFGSLTLVPTDTSAEDFAELVKTEICQKLHPEIK